MLEIPAWAETVKDTATYLSWISCITSFFTIISLMICPEKRAFPARLPLYMSISIFGVILSALFGLYFPETLCFPQAIGLEFFGQCSVWWWVIITFNFHKTLREMEVPDSNIEPYYCLLGWGLPFILLVVALGTNSLDSKSHPYNWECWMQHQSSSAQWFLFYGEMAIACVFGVLLWCAILTRLYQTHSLDYQFSGTQKPIMIKYIRHVLFVTLFLVVFILMLVYRIKMATNEKGAGFTLTLTHTICVTGTGLYIFLVFGLTSSNLKRWQEILCSNVNEDDGYKSPSTDLSPVWNYGTISYPNSKNKNKISSGSSIDYA